MRRHALFLKIAEVPDPKTNKMFSNSTLPRVPRELFVKIQPKLASADRAVRQAAFAELIKDIRVAEERWLKWKVPALHEHMVEEALNDAFLRLWNDLRKPGWKKRWDRDFLRRVARNKCSNRLRKLTRAKRRFGDHQRIIPETHEEEMDVFGAESPQIEGREQQKRHLEIFRETVKSMPIHQRRVARLLLEIRSSRLGLTELIALHFKAYRIRLVPEKAKSTLAAVRGKMRAARARAESSSASL